MIVGRTEDVELINQVLKHPEIWPCIADKENDKDEFIPPMQDHHYIIGTDGDQVIGVMVYHKANGWKCHVQVLPEYREKYGFKFGQKVLEWFWNNVNSDKITATIPAEYPNVVRFAELNGFSLDRIEKGINFMFIEREY